jgi:UDP-glucose 4-epimerase
VVLNLGSGTGYSVREVSETVARVTGREVPVTVAARRPGDPPRLVASNARAAEVLGWAPAHDLDRMVADAWSARTGGTR